MRVIYMGRKPSSIEGLKYLIEKGIEIAVVVTFPKTQKVHWKERLIDVANYYGIPTAIDEDLYDYLSNPSSKSKYKFDLANIDLVLSFLFWKRIKMPLISLPKIGCINFHPAPLPEFRGIGGYNFAIYENLNYWGVSAHFVDENFDTGDIIKVMKFDIDPKRETAFSLEQKSQKFLIDLFKSVINDILEKREISRIPQGKGRYITKQELENLKKIHFKDSTEEIKKKIRALWYPPYLGAYIEIDGEKFTLIDEELLKEIGSKYHQ